MGRTSNFLNQQTSQQAPLAEHALIKELIGADREVAPEQLRALGQYQPGALSPVDQ